jgi:hypothetical protein
LCRQLYWLVWQPSSPSPRGDPSRCPAPRPNRALRNWPVQHDKSWGLAEGSRDEARCSETQAWAVDRLSCL